MKHNNLSYAVRIEIGNRDEQQDSVATFAEHGLFAATVCDGMGGLGNGQLASKVATDIIMTSINERSQNESVPDMFISSIDILDEAIYMLADNNGNKLEAGTTVVSAYIDETDLYWMSVGDSRLYMMRNNEIVQATRDHNYSLYLESVKDTYTPTTDDLENEDALISFIGMGGISIMDVSSNPVKLVNGDIVLITSDGLYKVLSDNDIKDTILQYDDVEVAADELIKKAEALAPDSRDNISFVLIKYSIEGEV